MKKEKIIIANLKCSGCATTIAHELLHLNGVKHVDVIVDEDAVEVEYENIERNIIIQKLHDLGYPEATEENGLLLQVKSFSSCMLGRMKNMTATT